MYYIDGYNLLFKIDRSSLDLKNQRDYIIRTLNKYFAQINLEAFIVFDSPSIEGPFTQNSLSNLHIVYTAHGESADEWIYSTVERSLKPQNLIVVTSDKALTVNIKALGAKAVSIETFLLWLKKKFHTSLLLPKINLSKNTLPKEKHKRFNEFERVKEFEKLNDVSADFFDQEVNKNELFTNIALPNHQKKKTEQKSNVKNSLQLKNDENYRLEKEYVKEVHNEPNKKSVFASLNQKIDKKSLSTQDLVNEYPKKNQILPRVYLPRDGSIDYYLKIFEKKLKDFKDF
jgi:predicted RNA-binding protein with PIN domain